MTLLEAAQAMLEELKYRTSRNIECGVGCKCDICNLARDAERAIEEHVK